MSSSSTARSLSLFTLALLLGACVAGAGEDDPAVQQGSSTFEFQDIFIPDRLVEIPERPAGTVSSYDVVIHNAGDYNLTLYEVSLNYQSDDNWSINQEDIPELIEPHQFVVVTVWYTAQQGPDTFAAIDVYSDDPDEAEKTVAFIGHSASGGPEARLSDAIVDYGFQYTGVEQRRIIEVRNDGEDDLWITGVELIQSDSQPTYTITCPGQPLDACDFWQTPSFSGQSTSDLLLGSPILPGARTLIEVAFVPISLQGVSAQLKIYTNDPFRPTFTIFLLGNGQNAFNCTPPEVKVVSPAEAAFFHSWEEMVISARVFDQEQPPGSLYVEMWLGDLYIENEYPDETGLVTFRIDLSEHEPSIPSGLQTLTLVASDGCPLQSSDVVVVGIDFPLSQADVDGDGYDPNQGDCDESDPDTFPQAIEQPDGVDNDCDGTIDENTIFWDDDGDGFCEAENPLDCRGTDGVWVDDGSGNFGPQGGDCNDSTGDLDGDGVADGNPIHPLATELLNFVDDNCDQVTDEGTSFFDDDGDGQTEAVGDCDDEDPQIFVGAIEFCDALDNDCDGDIDEDCVDGTTPPRIIGGVLTERFQVALGGRVQAQVLVVSQDPESLSYEWSTDRGSYDEGAAGPVVFWNAPEDNDENLGFVGDFPTLLVTVRDSNGVDYGFGNVLLSRDVRVAATTIVSSGGGGGGTGCSVGGSEGSGLSWALLALIGGLGLLRRRRVPGSAAH